MVTREKINEILKSGRMITHSELLQFLDFLDENELGVSGLPSSKHGVLHCVNECNGSRPEPTEDTGKTERDPLTKITDEKELCWHCKGDWVEEQEDNYPDVCGMCGAIQPT